MLLTILATALNPARRTQHDLPAGKFIRFIPSKSARKAV